MRQSLLTARFDPLDVGKQLEVTVPCCRHRRLLKRLLLHLSKLFWWLNMVTFVKCLGQCYVHIYRIILSAKGQKSGFSRFMDEKANFRAVTLLAWGGTAGKRGTCVSLPVVATASWHSTWKDTKSSRHNALFYFCEFLLDALFLGSGASKSFYRVGGKTSVQVCIPVLS